MRPLTLFSAIVLASTIVFAQHPNGGGPGPVLGIVEIPEMFYLDPTTGQYVVRGADALYPAGLGEQGRRGALVAGSN